MTVTVIPTWGSSDNVYPTFSGQNLGLADTHNPTFLKQFECHNRREKSC